MMPENEIEVKETRKWWKFFQSATVVLDYPSEKTGESSANLWFDDFRVVEDPTLPLQGVDFQLQNIDMSKGLLKLKVWARNGYELRANVQLLRPESKLAATVTKVKDLTEEAEQKAEQIRKREYTLAVLKRISTREGLLHFIRDEDAAVIKEFAEVLAQFRTPPDLSATNVAPLERSGMRHFVHALREEMYQTLAGQTAALSILDEFQREYSACETLHKQACAPPRAFWTWANLDDSDAWTASAPGGRAAEPWSEVLLVLGESVPDALCEEKVAPTVAEQSWAGMLSTAAAATRGGGGDLARELFANHPLAGALAALAVIGPSWYSGQLVAAMAGLILDCLMLAVCSVVLCFGVAGAAALCTCALEPGRFDAACAEPARVLAAEWQLMRTGARPTSSLAGIALLVPLGYALVLPRLLAIISTALTAALGSAFAALLCAVFALASSSSRQEQVHAAAASLAARALECFWTGRRQ
jgi:hypothetical protein